MTSMVPSSDLPRGWTRGVNWAGEPDRTSMKTSVLTVTEVCSSEGFSAIAEEWRDLLSDSDSDCVFLTWDWLYTWWMHLSERRSLRILIIRRGNFLVGIAPFSMRPAEPRRLLPFRAVEFLGVGLVGSDYLDLILRKGEEHAACAAIADYIEKWNLMLDMRRVKSGSSAVEILVIELSRRGWKTLETDDDGCAYVPLSGLTWDRYMTGLGASFRASLRRRRRQAQTNFEVEYISVNLENERADALGQFVRLHKKRWENRNGTQALPDEAIVRFHEKWSRIALERGWLRLSLLRFNETVVAGIYAFAYRKKLYFYLSGFDPAYEKFSPGRMCQEESLHQAIDQGLREYDFLHGGERYKFHWARHARALRRYRLFPPSVRGRLSRLILRFRESCKSILGKGYGTGMGEMSKTSRSGK